MFHLLHHFANYAITFKLILFLFAFKINRDKFTYDVVQEEHFYRSNGL